MKVTIENNELVIRLPIEEPTLSTSGKTLLIASSHGSQATPAEVDGKMVTVTATAYISKY